MIEAKRPKTTSESTSNPRPTWTSTKAIPRETTTTARMNTACVPLNPVVCIAYGPFFSRSSISGKSAITTMDRPKESRQLTDTAILTGNKVFSGCDTRLSTTGRVEEPRFSILTGSRSPLYLYVSMQVIRTAKSLFGSEQCPLEISTLVGLNLEILRTNPTTQ